MSITQAAMGYLPGLAQALVLLVAECTICAEYSSHIAARTIVAGSELLRSHRQADAFHVLLDRRNPSEAFYDQQVLGE